MERYNEGDILEIASMKGRLEGACTLNNGDRLVYRGNSLAKVISGPSTGRLVYLSIYAPVIHIIEEPN